MGLAVFLANVPQFYEHRFAIRDDCGCSSCCWNVARRCRRPVLEATLMRSADLLPTDYWNADRMAEVFSYTKWFLKLNMPWIMFGAAFFVVCGVVGIIIGLFFRSNEPKRTDEDSDYDIYYH